MLIVICGEDNVASRNYFSELKDVYTKKGYSLLNISFKQLPEVINWISENLGLFDEKRLYLIENLNKYVKGKDKNTQELINKIILSKKIEMIDWEDGKSQREIRIKGAVIKEFKPADSIFKLTEACFPGNLRQFQAMMSSLIKSSDENFVYYMLKRQFRLLILAKSEVLPKSMPSWQSRKINFQARLWSFDKLLKFYDGLYRIDLQTKTGSSPYGITNSLDILACYFL